MTTPNTELNPLNFPHLGKNKKPLPTKENLTELLQSGSFSIEKNATTKDLNIFLNGDLIGSAGSLSIISTDFKKRHFYLHLKSFCVQSGLTPTALDYLPLIVADFAGGEK